MEMKQLEDVEAAVKALEDGTKEEASAALQRVRSAMHLALERTP